MSIDTKFKFNGKQKQTKEYDGREEKFPFNSKSKSALRSFPPFVLNIRKSIFYVVNVVPAFNHVHSHMKTNHSFSSVKWRESISITGYRHHLLFRSVYTIENGSRPKIKPFTIHVTQRDETISFAEFKTKLRSCEDIEKM